MVGKSGNTRLRSALVTPSARSLPDLMCGSVTASTSMRICTCPPSKSVTAGALPAGLALSNDGHLSGTPTAPGSYSFTATVSDGATSSSKGMSLTIIPGITVNAAPSVPTAEVRTNQLSRA